jgi:hypothetical protein
MGGWGSVSYWFDLARQRVERVVLGQLIVAGQWSGRSGCRGWSEILPAARRAQDDKRGMRAREGMELKSVA